MVSKIACYVLAFLCSPVAVYLCVGDEFPLFLNLILMVTTLGIGNIIHALIIVARHADNLD